jgi:uncharacterized protein (DUF111 family)
MPSLFRLSMQHLAQDVAEVAELPEEVTRARAAAIMVEACTTQVERLAQDRAVLLATTHVEVDEVDQRVSFLEGELVAACPAWEAVEEKLPSLAAKASAVDRRWVAAEEQCESLVHELTLLNLRGSELCVNISGALP